MAGAGVRGCAPPEMDRTAAHRERRPHQLKPELAKRSRPRSRNDESPAQSSRGVASTEARPRMCSAPSTCCKVHRRGLRKAAGFRNRMAVVLAPALPCSLKPSGSAARETPARVPHTHPHRQMPPETSPPLGRLGCRGLATYHPSGLRRAARRPKGGRDDMRLDAIAIGNDPPRDINVIIEVPIGGSRSSTRWTRLRERSWSTASSIRRCGTRKLRVRPPHAVGRRRSDRRAGLQHARSLSWCGHQLPARRRARDAG